MIYCGKCETELILMYEEEDTEGPHYISLEKAVNEPTFCVSCCCDNEWVWTFQYRSVTDYERVKWCIMDVLHECENMYQLMDLLNEIFVEVFNDIVIYEEECCGNCECCNLN